MERVEDQKSPVLAEPAGREPVVSKALPAERLSWGRVLKGSRDLSRWAVVILAVLGIIGFLYLARAIFLPLVFALMLSFLFRPLVRGLAYVKIPAPIGAAFVLAVTLWGVGNAVSQLQKPAMDWLDAAPESIKQVESKIRDFIRRAHELRIAADKVGEITQMPETVKPTQVEIRTSYLSSVLLSFTTNFLTGLIETTVLLYFFLAGGDLLVQKLVKITPGIRQKEEVGGIVHEVQHSISTFLFTITVINICLGVLVALAVYAVGMKNAVLWGVVAALLNFIPYFGPFTGVIVLSIAGLLSFDSVGEGLLPPVIYLGLHALESNFITPMVLGRRLTLNPVVIFLSLMFWMWLWGIPGALLAVPFLMTFKILCDHFKPLASFGELLSS